MNHDQLETCRSMIVSLAVLHRLPAYVPQPARMARSSGSSSTTIPRRLSGRSGRRQRRQEARHHRRGRRHVRLVRESDLEEADRDDRQADARHHQQRHGRPRRRRQGRDRDRLRVRDERADQGQARCWRVQGRGWTIPGRSSPSPKSAAFTDCDGATSMADKTARPDRRADLRPEAPAARVRPDRPTSACSNPGRLPKRGRWNGRGSSAKPRSLHAIEVDRRRRRRTLRHPDGRQRGVTSRANG